MLEADKIETINFPTETHREFIVFISQQCKKDAITALLKGSMAKGNAQEHSDIDIILTGKNISNYLDLIIGSFDKILLSEHFAATSTYMVVYANGLAVEYDVRKTVTEEDIRNLTYYYNIWTGYYNGTNINARVARDINTIQTSYTFFEYYLRYPDHFSPTEILAWTKNQDKLNTEIGFKLWEQLILNNVSYRPFWNR